MRIDVKRPRGLLLVIAIVLTGTFSFAQTQARIVESTTGIVGLAEKQTAVLNVLDEGASGSSTLYALLAFLDGEGIILSYQFFTLQPGKLQKLELSHGGLQNKGRVPLRGLLRLYGQRASVPRFVQLSMEIVDDDTGRTGPFVFCPSDFQFAGDAGGRGDVFDCGGNDCNVKILNPGS